MPDDTGIGEKGGGKSTRRSGQDGGSAGSAVAVDPADRETMLAERDRFYTTLERIPAFVYLQAPDYSIRFGNQRFRDLFGDLDGRPCYAVIQGRDRPCEPCPTFEVFRTREVGTWEWRRGERETYMIYDSFLADVDGTPLVLEMGVDITGRKLAEEALLEREGALRHRIELEHLVSSVSTRFVGIPEERTQEGIQEALREIGTHTGADRSYLILLSDGRVGETREWCAAGIEPQIHRFQNLAVDRFPWLLDQLRTGQTVHVPDVGELPAGASAERQTLQAQKVRSVLLVPMRSSPTGSRPEELKGAVGIAFVRRRHAWAEEDVTLLRTIGDIFLNALERVWRLEEKEILERRLRQVQRMEAMGSLAGGIAHDFNNILSAIRGNAEMGLQDLPEHSASRYSFQQILKASRRARDLVEQILTFSRQREQPRRPVYLGTIVKEVLRLLRASLPSTIEIRRDLAAERDRVLADPAQIHQVLMNLCTNAFHAMRADGGVLEVGTRDVRNDPAATEGWADLEPGDHVQLWVRDSGCGMSGEVLERIFEPYFTTKEKELGTGLGLSMVQAIVRQHRGSVRVESELGSGTTFSLLFPVVDAAVEEGPVPARPLPRGTGRVLFVDDEEDLTAVSARMLEHLGYEVTTVNACAQALELFRSGPDGFDVVITDMTMPGMTGLQLSRAMLGLRPGIPILLCTGFEESVTEEQAVKAGCRGRLLKPIGMADLARAVRDALDSP